MELRPLDLTHDALLTELQQQDDVWEFIGAVPLSGFESGNHAFAIVDGASELGFAGLFRSRVAGRDDYELLCATRSEAQHHGIATQACQLVLDWAHDTAKLDRVIACIDEANQPARMIADKLGMSEVGRAADGRLLYAKEFRPPRTTRKRR